MLIFKYGNIRVMQLLLCYKFYKRKGNTNDKIFSKNGRKICKSYKYSLRNYLDRTSTKNASIFNKKRLILNNYNNVLNIINQFKKKTSLRSFLFYIIKSHIFVLFYKLYIDNSCLKKLLSLLVNKSKFLLFFT